LNNPLLLYIVGKILYFYLLFPCKLYEDLNVPMRPVKVVESTRPRMIFSQHDLS